VQRRFTKRRRGYQDLSYEERLKRLNLHTLELRRIKSDLVLCYKIIFGVVHLSAQDFFDLAITSTSGHRFKFYKHFSSCSDRSSFYSERIVNIWNGLPVYSSLLILALCIVLEIYLMQWMLQCLQMCN